MQPVTTIQLEISGTQDGKWLLIYSDPKGYQKKRKASEIGSVIWPTTEKGAMSFAMSSVERNFLKLPAYTLSLRTVML